MAGFFLFSALSPNFFFYLCLSTNLNPASMKKIFIPILLFSVSFIGFSQKKKIQDAEIIARPSTDVIGTLGISATSANERLAGYEQRKKLQENSLFKNLKFKNIGPTVMSGRVVDIDANPDNPSEFYVAYASGGLWHTVNNGQSFTPIFDNEAVMTIGDIAVDWKTRTIWVGTGENNSSRSSYSGVGMYKSSDNGKTWQSLGLPESHHIGRIALHPSDANVAWVAVLGHLYSFNSERGVYKTTDGGKTWKNILSMNEKTGAIDVRLDPTNPNTLYAALWHRERTSSNFIESGTESGIYKSTDGGETWKDITSEGSGFPQGKGNGRIGLAVYPKNPNIIYAIIDNQAFKEKKEDKKEVNKLTKQKVKTISKEEFLALSDTLINEYLDENNFPEKYSAKNIKEDLKADKIKLQDIYLYTYSGNDDILSKEATGAEVYRSEDAGKTWKRTHEGNLDDLYYSYGYYFGQIWVAPDDDKKLVIVGVPIVRSEDGGKTFKSIDRSNVHADHHALWINPKDSKHYINGNDGGINITYDDGKTWFKANTIPVGQFYAVAVDMAKPYQVYGGLQDNGVWYGSSANNIDFNYGVFDGGDGYKFLMGGDGMQVQVDWRDNNTVYAGSQFGFYQRINKATGERKYLQIPRDLGESPFRFNWEAPITLSRHNQDILYFGSNKFHRSLDKGDTFKTLSGDLTRGKREGDVPFGTLSTIEESPTRFGLLYAGSDDGLIHLSKDGGYTWSKIMDKENLWVSGIAVSNHAEGTVYVSLNAYRQDHFKPYLFVSTDYGQNWKNIGENLPAEPLNVVKEDPKNANILYVGTDNGLYISLDKGQTFMALYGDNLPAVSVHDLVIHPRENELIVGTHGRSIYLADIKPIQALTNEVLAKDLYLYDLPSITYASNWGKKRNQYEEDKELKYHISYYAKKAGKTKLTIQTEKGLVLKTITDEAEAGLNYTNFDHTIDISIKDEYQKFLNETKKKEAILEPADDKKIYFRTGKYKVIIEQNGSKIEKSLEIKAPENRSRRVSIPAGVSSPDEWLEEMGLDKD
jgi:photosystem II stability/assembly factor-like uncharacterized protein